MGSDPTHRTKELREPVAGVGGGEALAPGTERLTRHAGSDESHFAPKPTEVHRCDVSVEDDGIAMMRSEGRARLNVDLDRRVDREAGPSEPNRETAAPGEQVDRRADFVQRYRDLRTPECLADCSCADTSRAPPEPTLAN